MAARLEEMKIAARYARAVFESAVEAGDAVEKDVTRSIKELGEVFEEIPALGDFFKNPAIPAAEKLDLLKTQTQKKVPELVYNLLLVMLENDRLSVFPALAKRVEELSNERHQVAVAEVITAVELPKSLEKKFETVLKKRYGLSQVTLQKRVDPGILGGAIIKIQDKVIDGSFVGKLETLRKQIG
jgi:F-type H+-transporting ATPase subunit delta